MTRERCFRKSFLLQDYLLIRRECLQSNSVAQVLTDIAGIPWWITGVVLMLLVGAVILGGIKRIADTAGAVVPAMAISYIVMSLVVILMNISEVPAAFTTIIDSALMAIRPPVVLRAPLCGRPSGSGWHVESSLMRRALEAPQLPMRRPKQMSQSSRDSWPC